jgi:hypothetical protein
LSSFAPVAGTPGGFSRISPSDNLFGFMSTMLVPNSEEMQPQFTPSSNWQLLTGPFGEPTLPGIGSVAGTSHHSWNDQSQEQRVINGGTFIGGDLNYVVMPPSRIPISIVLLYLHGFCRYFYMSSCSTD